MQNFKAISLRIKKVTATFASVQKEQSKPPPFPKPTEEEKKTKKTWKFDHPYSPKWREAIMQKSHAFLKGSQSYACVKIAF